MHIELLAKRLEGLRQQHQNALAQVNALVGAIQIVEVLIKDFTDAQAAATTPAPKEEDKPVSSVVD